MDSGLLWLDFFNYMTLNKIFVGVELGAHLLISVIALSWFQTVLLDGPSWWAVLVFVIQYFICYPAFLIYTQPKLKAHYAQQMEQKKEVKEKTLKGRMKLKMAEKIAKQAKP